MLAVEFAHHILAEGETYTTVVVSVLFHTALRVRPKKVAQKACVRYISWPHDVFNLLQFFQLWAKPTVHTEDFLINEGGNREAVEDVREDLPESDRIPAFAFVVEAVNAVDLGALMIAAQQEEIFGVLYLVAQQQAYSLDRLLSPVDIVPQEQVVCFWREPAVLENAQ